MNQATTAATDLKVIADSHQSSTFHSTFPLLSATNSPALGHLSGMLTQTLAPSHQAFLALADILVHLLP
jgi:hypothetical protein